ncbi:LacI family transcriptional regulator [Plantibacter sp. Leaf171]|uniref:LacI family DNA-binding transcriptional regulator n=1 Tax=unclassified Plantibacter TaxID=2624265 RepID=UPI0006F5C894|nr:MULTISPECIES: LacI family DNA-binding transcriptional regulator [unclassified Plantibacter]KQM16489.1 LacI family transcriptional regulator [Plantibacter sp. Leaf1]KQQ52601.1 LacI family transcriptional regulator [Plantibacter sp. Leaf314]KQR59624.1 LacI family transcriptional regulator [Plantibacter sp. Leaf171]
MTTVPSRRRPTIDDVAEAAGVSRGTVSRVLNGGRWVSQDAKAAVDAAIRKTGYRVNPHARSLATNRTGSVAFLLTENHQLLFEDPNFSMLLTGAAQALAERQLSLVLIMAGSAAEQERALAYIEAGHVDGVLLVSAHSGQRLISDIVDSKVPAIACGIPLGFQKRLGYVAADDLEGAREMVAHLRSLGRERIATVAGPADTPGGVTRLEGYRLELGDAFDERLVRHGDYGRASGEAAMRELLAADPTIDAVFVANDRMAAGAIDALHAAGKRVPEDVAVGGFDDSSIALGTEPALTTMRQPFERISAEMVRLLLQVIEGERPAAITLPTELVVRDSA